MSEIIDAYSHPTMAEAIRAIRGYKEQRHGQSAPYAYDYHYQRQDPANYPVDDARRVVAHHFTKIFKLHQGKYMSKEQLKIITNPEQIRMYLELIEPLERAVNPNYDEGPFSFLAKLWNLQDWRESMRKANPVKGVADVSKIEKPPTSG